MPVRKGSSRDDNSNYRNDLIFDRENLVTKFKENYIISSAGNVRSGMVDNQYIDGSRYLGRLVHNKREGKGVYYYKNGDIYAGDWQNDVFEGKGMYIYASGERYEGQLKNGMKHGKGKYLYITACVYDGDWILDNKNG